ncbi:MAG: outer membrane beta-barrel protein [Bryobacteraceae bacterium]|nr:outer membrane beta-barrel protein [Bryobacteraceae bacterium]
MNKLRLSCGAFLLLAASATAVNAQVAEFGVAGGITRLTNADLSSGYTLDDGWNVIFRLTVNNDTYMGHEFGYAYNRTKLLLSGASQGGMAAHQGFYNYLLYGAREGKRVRPFVTGGGHFTNFVPPGASATQGGGSTKFGVNYGGGVKVKLTDKYLFRVDYRQNLQGKPFGDSLPVSGWLKLNQISAGISFTL